MTDFATIVLAPQEDVDDDDMGTEENAAGVAMKAGSTRNSVAERARFIPLRLNPDERRLLRLLEAALSVSECELVDLPPGLHVSVPLLEAGFLCRNVYLT